MLSRGDVPIKDGGALAVCGLTVYPNGMEVD